MMLGFRVWYFDKMWYEENSKVVMNSKGELCEIYQGGACPYSPNSELYPSAPIPMQSTGLRDCNNVMAYEGDILELRMIDADMGIDMSLFTLIENVVTFLLDWRSFLFNHGDGCIIIVAGNRFENPELLEKIKC